MSEGYTPVPVQPDPARDARVAARRRDDAARAGRALDRLLADQCSELPPVCDRWHVCEVHADRNRA